MQMNVDFVEELVGTASNKNGGIGESYVAGKWNTRSTNGQYGSGGGGVYQKSNGDTGLSGAGAGHGTSGTNGGYVAGKGQAKGGTAFALNTIKEKIFMGAGGGQGGSDNANPHDTKSAREKVMVGRGGGIVIIDAIYCELTSSGVVSANGQQGPKHMMQKRRSRKWWRWGGGFYFIHRKCRKQW